jgi:hypothetical protein
MQQRAAGEAGDLRRLRLAGQSWQATGRPGLPRTASAATLPGAADLVATTLPPLADGEAGDHVIERIDRGAPASSK